MTLSLNVAGLTRFKLIKEVCFDTLRFKALAWVLLATPCLSVAADSYNYSFTTASLSGSLILVTTPQGGGISLVTSATGTINSSAVTLVAPGAFAGNDNRVQIDFTQPVGSQAKFNGAGLSVQTAGPTITYYNIWGSGPGYSGLGTLSEFNTGQLLLTNSISMVSDGPSSSSSSSSSSSPPPPVDIVHLHLHLHLHR